MFICRTTNGGGGGGGGGSDPPPVKGMLITILTFYLFGFINILI